MKKIYIFTLALGIASASMAAVPAKNAVKVDITAERSLPVLTNAIKANEPMRANEQWEPVGEGVFVDPIVAAMYDQSNDPITVTIEKSGSKYRVLNPWPTMGEGTELIIDAADPEMVVVPLQVIFDDPYGDGDTNIESVNQLYMELQGLTKDQILQQFADQNITMSNNVIYFGANSVMFRWPNATPSQYTDPSKWYTARDAEPGYLQLPGGVVEKEWEEIGTGTMNDGIVAPFLSGNATDRYEVQVEKSTKKEGVYRIIKPFVNIYEDCKNLVIDASNPNCIVIDQQNTGIMVQDMGSMYVLSRSANYATIEDFLASDQAGYNITLANNIINIPANGCFAYFPDTDPTYVYSAENPAACTIELPNPNSIENITLDSNAPVEYYNLQGMRVTNPEKGQIVIARQGSKAEKYIVK